MLLAMVRTLTKNARLMKMNLYKIGVLAVTALTFAGCSRETEIKQDVAGTHVVTVNVTKDFDTRTAIVEEAEGASYKWTQGDEAYFHIFENGVAATSLSMSLDAEGRATFTATFPNSSATSFEYTARYFDEESNSHNPLIKATQKPTLTSFDPSADVLIAASQTKNEPATQLQFALKRVVSVNKMTLKGLVAGEKIESVELASTDKNFSANYVLSTENYSAAGKKLTFDYSELATAVVDNDGTFPVYFVSAPVTDATFSVKVTTDQNVYLRDNFTSKLTLTVSQVKRFGIQLGDYGSPISTGTTYTLVESADQICDGATYIIVGTNAAGDEYSAMGAQTNNNRSAEAVSVKADGSIILDNSTSVHSFTLGETTEGYTLLDNDETSGYLYAAGAAATKQNYLRSSAELIDNAYWSINFSGTAITIKSINNSKTPYMQYNSTNNLFSCYNTASQSPVYLYVDVTTCTPTPRIIVTPAAIEDVNYKGGSFSDLQYELRNLEGEAATITCDGEVVVNAMADPEMEGRIIYRVSPNGTEEDREGWIKISAGTVEKVVPVDQHAAPSHEIILDGVSAEGVVYVGPNVNDATTITVLSSYYWLASATCDGVENSFEIDTEEGNLDGEESDVTEITITAKVANDGEERYLGDIEIDNDGDEPTIISVWQSAAQSYDFETIAELNNLVTATSATYTGYLTDATVSFVPAPNTAIIKDATGSIMYYAGYNGTHSLQQGQTFTGELEVTAILFTSTNSGNTYNLYPEITAWDAVFTGSAAAVAPQSLALSSLVGNYSVYQNAYVQVAGLTVTGVSGKNINVTDGTNSYVVYDNPGTATCGTGDVITATGTVTKYQNTEEIKVWKASDIIITGTAPKAITFSQPTGAAATAGCLIKVKVDGSEITSGTTVASGTTVTLEATVGDDYTFAGWTVTGATVADASATNTTFTMGTSAVSVSASFTKTGGGSYTITFTTGSGDGSSASTSTACSTIVSDGSQYLSGNLVTATKVYYNGSDGLKLGTSSAAGIVKMNLASSITPVSIVVRAKLYNSSKAATLKVNGSTAQSISSNFSDLTFNVSSSISYLELEASKYCWIQSITVNY